MDWKFALDAQIRAVAPIISLKLVDITDKSTWKIIFDDSATNLQKLQAIAIIKNFDMTLINVPPRTIIDDIMDKFANIQSQIDQIKTTITPTTSV